MAVYLTTQGMRIVESNERGNVVYQREYTFGEEIDTEHMDPARVQNLLDSGDLTETDPKKAKAVDTSEHGVNAAALAGPVGAAAVDAVGNPVTPTGEPGAGVDQTAEQSDDPADEHDVDEFDAMDYTQLQAAAKDAGVPANQSADELRAALRDA